MEGMTIFTYNRQQSKIRRGELRKGQTDVEDDLWQKLRRRQCLGYRWHRQYGVGQYILDFYCPALRLAIELDGWQHKDPLRRSYDKNRTSYLKELDITVIRFWDGEVIKNLNLVVQEIKYVITSNPTFNPTHPPLTLRGGEKDV